MPARMLVEMVKASVFWLNTFPSSDGVSDTMSPRLLIVGFNVDYAKHCKLEFGTYAQVHEDHDNSMATRTTGAIALRPTGNAQGGYYFMSLTTGRRLNRNHWTELPMPQDVINRVRTLARRSNGNKSLLFTDRHGGAINDSGDDEDDNEHYTEDNNDDDDDDNFVPGVDQDDDNDDRDPDNDALNGLNGDDDDNLDNNDNDDNVNNDDIPLAGVDDGDDPDIAGVTDGADTPANDEDTNENDNNDDENDAERAGVRFATTTTDEEGNEEDIEDEEGNEEDIEDIKQKYGKRTTAHNLRSRKPRDYGHMHTTLEHTSMTQHSVKKGLKEFGKAGSDAVIAEMQQLHDRDVIEPKKANQLTQGEENKALHYLMFLKKKRCGRIKGRGWKETAYLQDKRRN
jgi:hypothetical protein